ncbi:MAG: thioredoxin family protein [Chitinophagales bacterium]|nr:thioredoxin family protein [Chitinophagales bacterium]
MTKVLLVISVLAVFAFIKNRFTPYPESSDTGIQFFKGTWDEAAKKSAAENKPIFLDIYASWCGPCKKLKRTTFADDHAGKFFNEHFINVELDGEKGEGRMLAEKYGVRGYPSLFLIGEDEKVITYSAGYRSASELIDFGKSAFK